MDLPWGFYLGWDWPWLVFFIVLGLSIALASVARKWQVFWIIPAFVLYQGLLWDIPDGWSTVFRVLFWLTFGVAVVTAILPGATRLAKVPMYLMIGLVVWCLLLFVLKPVIGFFDSRDDSAAAPRDLCLKIDNVDNGEIQEELPPGVTDEDGDRYCLSDDAGDDADPSPSPTADADPACPSHLVQRPISDEEKRRFIRSGIDSATTEKSWDKLGRALLHDASSLRQMAVYFEVDGIPSLEQLVTDNGECLSEDGVELHDDLMNIGRGMLDRRFGFAPLDGHNSWIDRHGHLVIDKRQVIAGDRRSLVFIDGEGRERHILVRCGNPVFATRH